MLKSRDLYYYYVFFQYYLYIIELRLLVQIKNTNKKSWNISKTPKFLNGWNVY